MHELGLTREEVVCQSHGIEFLSYPILDRGLPENVAAASALVGRLHRSAYAGRGVIVHCRAGIGRTGMIAAGVLLHEGLSPADAFELISRARRVPVPDTQEQVRWIEDQAVALLAST